MQKTDLVNRIAKDAGLTKAAADKAVNAFVGAITRTLKKGEKVTLVGFGTFSVGRRAARTGRNPRTGETIKIKASRTPKFNAGKALKDAVRR
ncbi:MAG: HU family DNA-binding protein [Nitrospinota bacterium]